MQEPSEIQLNPLHETSEVFQTGERLTIATALKRFASCWNAGLAWVAFRLNVQLRKELRNLPLRTFLPLRSLHPFWGGCTCQPNPGAANAHYLFWSLQVSHFQYFYWKYGHVSNIINIINNKSSSNSKYHPHQHVPCSVPNLNRLCTCAFMVQSRELMVTPQLKDQIKQNSQRNGSTLWLYNSIFYELFEWLNTS